MIKKKLAIILLIPLGGIYAQTNESSRNITEENVLLFNYDLSGNQIKRYFSIIIESQSRKALAYDTIEVEDNELKNNNVKIYPNPSIGPVNLIFENDLTISKVFILDMKNSVVKSYLNNENQTNLRIDLSEFPMGVYVLQIESKDGKKIFSKIIKN